MIQSIMKYAKFFCFKGFMVLMKGIEKYDKDLKEVRLCIVINICLILNMSIGLYSIQSSETETLKSNGVEITVGEWQKICSNRR